MISIQPHTYIVSMYKYSYLAGFLKTLPATGWTFSIQQLYIKTKSVTIAFFSSPPFLLLTPYFSPFLFVCWFDFVAYRAQESYLLTHFHSNDIGFRKIGQLYACSMLDHFTVTSFIVPFDTLNLFPFLTKIMLINTSQHKNNMIYIIKQEGLRQNKVNSNP